MAEYLILSNHSVYYKVGGDITTRYVQNVITLLIHWLRLLRTAAATKSMLLFEVPHRANFGWCASVQNWLADKLYLGKPLVNIKRSPILLDNQEAVLCRPRFQEELGHIQRHLRTLHGPVAPQVYVVQDHEALSVDNSVRLSI